MNRCLTMPVPITITTTFFFSSGVAAGTLPSLDRDIAQHPPYTSSSAVFAPRPKYSVTVCAVLPRMPRVPKCRQRLATSFLAALAISPSLARSLNYGHSSPKSFRNSSMGTSTSASTSPDFMSSSTYILPSLSAGSASRVTRSSAPSI